MSGGDFWVDTNGLRNSGTGFDNIAGGVIGIHLNHIGPYEGSWGGDDAGEKFAPNYFQGRTAFIDGRDQLTRHIAQIADGIRQLAQLAGVTEHTNIDLAGKWLGPPPEGGEDTPPPVTAARVAKPVAGRPPLRRMLTLEEMAALGIPHEGGFRPLTTTISGEEFARRIAGGEPVPLMGDGPQDALEDPVPLRPRGITMLQIEPPG